jgi:phage repressor protein C with HTH and peptisase S24 domain
MDQKQALLSIAGMAKNEKAAIVGAAIRTARKRRGLVMKDIAAHVGKDVAAIGNWETGRNLPSTENLLKTADFLRVDAAALGRGEVSFLDDNEKLNEVEVITEAAPLQMGALDVKILGVAAGGDDGDFTLNGEVQGYARRPPGIAGLTNVFAVHIISDSMVPRYDPGELQYCGGRAPVPGDHVVIEMYPEEGATTGKAYIKKFVERAKGQVICEQYNPPKRVPFDAYSVKNMWRIIPPRELFGF